MRVAIKRVVDVDGGVFIEMCSPLIMKISIDLVTSVSVMPSIKLRDSAWVKITIR